MLVLTCVVNSPCCWVKLGINKVFILTLSSLFLFSSPEVIAQITCNSNPQVVQSSNNPHSDGINCVGNVVIELEDNTKIETTTKTGINVTDSNGVKITSGSRTLIKTSGDNTHGISISGGTGNYEVNVGDIEILGNGGNGIQVQPDSSTAGSSTTINVENITLQGTDGSSASGIDVQGPGNINIKSSGKIETKGNNVTGISIGHHNPGNSASGNIDIQVNDLETHGDSASGIYLRSLGIDSTKNIETDINITVSGILKTSGEFAQGIVVESADAEIIINIGTGGEVKTEVTEAGTYAIALVGTTGVGENQSALINNSGLVFGNILAEGCAQFMNRGTTVTQESIAISSTSCPSGTDSGFFNTGRVNIGGANEYRTTTFTGNYIQEESGQLLIDVDWLNNKIDLLAITGRANLAGSLVVNSFGVPDLSSYEFQRDVDFAGSVISSQTFLTATEGITGTLKYSSKNTLLLTNRVSKSPDNNELELTLAFGDGLGLLNRNQTNVFWGLNSARSESEDISDVFLDLFTMVELSNLQNTLDSLGNEIAGAIIRSKLRTMEQFGPPIDDCIRYPKEESEDTLEEFTKNCKFFTAKFTVGTHAGNFEQIKQEDKFLEGYFRIPLIDNNGDGQIQLLGKIDKSRIDVAEIAQSEGHSGTLGLGYVRETDIGTLSLVAQLGMGSHNITRSLSVLDDILTSNGTLKSRSAGISAGVSNSLKMGFGTVNWSIQAGYYRVISEPYTETGGGDFSLAVAKTATKSLVINPRIEFVGNIWNLDTLDITPLVGGGITHRSKPGVEFLSEFHAGGEKILSTTVLPETQFNYFLGADLAQPDNKLKGKVGYSGYIAEGNSLSGDKLSVQLTYHF